MPEDFPDNKLPTLYFLLWLDRNGLINYSYFQKLMKTPLVIMEKSAMGQNQRYSILSNEMIRRLSNTNHEQPDVEDVSRVIETFTQELKNSGYSRKQAREAVVSGFLGWRRKIQRRI